MMDARLFIVNALLVAALIAAAMLLQSLHGAHESKEQAAPAAPETQSLPDTTTAGATTDVPSNSAPSEVAPPANPVPSVPVQPSVPRTRNYEREGYDE